jgi:hypothetical protein
MRWMGWIVLCLLPIACASPPEDRTAAPVASRIVAIGDLHGDLDATRRALRLAGAVDSTDHWIGGTLIVVQTGDVLDRGDDEQAILDLFTRLAEEARAAGGAVHSLNGNHEIMNAELDLRYATEGGFADFEDAVTVGELDSVLAALEPAHRARAAAFRPGGPYARVLAERPVALVLGDNLFVHGGILPHHVDYGLDRLNAELRGWLLGETPKPAWIHAKGSPEWAREFSLEVDDDDCDSLAVVLSGLGVKRMIVGHTVQEEGINSYCGRRVWCIDVGMSEHYGSTPAQVLEIVGDSVRVLREEMPATE